MSRSQYGPSAAAPGPEATIEDLRERLRRGFSREPILGITVLAKMEGREAQLKAELAARESFLVRDVRAKTALIAAEEVARKMMIPPSPASPVTSGTPTGALDWLAEARQEIAEELAAGNRAADHFLNPDSTDPTD